MLRPGERLLSGFMNPDFYLFDHDDLDRGGPVQVRFSLPFADTEHLGDAESRSDRPGARLWSFRIAYKLRSRDSWMQGCCWQDSTKITGIPKPPL